MSQFSPNLSSGHPTNKTEYHYKGPDSDSQWHSSHQTCHQDILQTNRISLQGTWQWQSVSQFSSNVSSGHPTNKTEYHYKGPDNDSQCHSSHQTCHQDILQTNRISLQMTWQWQSNSQFSPNLSSGHPRNKTEYHYKGPDNDSQCHSSHQTCHQNILQIKQNITTRDLTMTVNVTVLTKLVIRTSYKQTEYHYKGPDNDSQCHSSHQTCHQDILEIKQNITTRDLTMTVNVTVLIKLVIGTSYKQNGISLQGNWQWQSMSQFSSNLSSWHPTNKTEYHYKGPDNDSQCHSSHQTCHQDILQIKQNITTRDLTVTVNVTVPTKLVIRTSYKQNRISLQGTWQWQSMTQFSPNLSSGHPTNKQNITTRDLTMTVSVTVLIKRVIRTSYK